MLLNYRMKLRLLFYRGADGVLEEGKRVQCDCDWQRSKWRSDLRLSFFPLRFKERHSAGQTPRVERQVST